MSTPSLLPSSLLPPQYPPVPPPSAVAGSTNNTNSSSNAFSSTSLYPGGGPSTTSSAGVLNNRRAPLHYTPAEIKKRIQQQLGKEKSDAYFRIFQDYIAGKLQKFAYDQQIKGLLNDGQKKLHNLFILTILRSAYSSLYSSQTRRSSKTTVVNPAQQQGQPGQAQQPQGQQPLGQQGTTSSAVSATTPNTATGATKLNTQLKEPNNSNNNVVVPEETIVSDLKCRSVEHKPSHYMPRTVDHVTTRDLTKQPLFNTLRTQMQYKATQLGLSDIDPSSISLMLLALEHHIKTVLVNCRSQKLRKKFPKPRLSTAHNNFLPLLEYKHKELMDTNRPGVIDQMDLQLTLEGTPEILGEQGLAVLEYVNLNRRETGF